MFKVTNKEIDDLVNKEYEETLKYGDTYNSEHEFYAVLKEEIEEVKFVAKEIEDNLGILWNGIKCNKSDAIPKVISRMEMYLNENIKESLQCLAVIKKYKNK